MARKPIVAVSGLPDGLGQTSMSPTMIAAWVGVAALSVFFVWQAVQPPKRRRRRS